MNITVERKTFHIWPVLTQISLAIFSLDWWLNQGFALEFLITGWGCASYHVQFWEHIIGAIFKHDKIL